MPAAGGKFGGFDLKIAIFIREIVLESCKKAKFSACGGLGARKGIKRLSEPAAGAKKIGVY